MTIEDWSAGTQRPEKLYWLLTDEQAYDDSIEEDFGSSISAIDEIDYTEKLMERVTANDLASAFKKHHTDFATNNGKWTFKFNPRFIGEKKGESIKQNAVIRRAKIDKLLDSFIKRADKNSIKTLQGLREETRRILYEFGDVEGALETSLTRTQDDELNDILLNFTFQNKQMNATKLRKNKPLSISQIRIWKDAVYREDAGLISLHIRGLESVASDKPNLETKIEPFIRKLKSLKTSGKDDIKTLHPDLFIGRINLKNLDGRNSIYNYWKDIHDDFEKYVDAQDKLHVVLKEKIALLKQLDKTERDENKPHPLDKYFEKLFDNKLDKRDNYVIEVKARSMDMDNRNVQAIILLTEFLKIYNKLEKPKSYSFDDAKEEGYGTGSATGGEERYDSAEWNPDIRIDRDIISPGEDERTLAEQASMEIGQQQRIPKNVITTILGDLKAIQSLKRVDPLFYYVWTNSEAFGRVPLFQKDVAAIKRMIRKKATRIDIFLEPSILDRLDDYIEELEETATDYKDTNKFYLPLTPKVADLAERDDTDKIYKTLKEHFDSLKNLMSLGGIKDKAYGTSATTRQKTLLTRDKKPISIYESTSSREKLGKNVFDLFDEIGDMSTNEYKEYMEALVEAFVIPLSSKHLPFDDEVEFLEENTMKLFRDEVKNPDAMGTLLMRYFELDTAAVSPRALEDITELLEEISKPAIERRLATLVPKIESVGQQLEEVFSQDHNKDIYIHFGKMLEEIREKNNIAEPIPFKDKTSEEWAKKYDHKKTYPLDALESHLRLNISSYESDARMTKIIKKYKQALDTIDKKIIKMEFEEQLLEAHDNIRKMLNKPVYYNTSSTDNYDHVNYAIEVVKEDYKVDLTATEVESIVGEFNSMGEIANKHGITQETVYFLKANFR